MLGIFLYAHLTFGFECSRRHGIARNVLTVSVAHTVQRSIKRCWVYDRIGSSSFLMAT